MDDRRLARRRLVVLWALLAMVSTAGCTGDRVRPSDTLPPTSSTSASPSTTEDAPGATGYPLPEAARAYTPEGARAFFDYFIAVLNASRPAHDPEPLREISQGCDYCDELSQRYAQGGVDQVTIIGGNLLLTSVGDVLLTPADSSAPRASMAFIIVQEAGQVFDTSGNLISDTPELELVGSIELAWLADQLDWLVSSYGVDTPS